MEHKVAVFRKEHFNAAHRLFCADWSDEKNMQVFGPCANPNYHGHNYELVVQVNGVPDPITGFVINTKDLSIIVKEEILDVPTVSEEADIKLPTIRHHRPGIITHLNSISRVLFVDEMEE
jgi:hypothetical protein